jgi:subtilisin family serine protease
MTLVAVMAGLGLGVHRLKRPPVEEAESAPIFLASLGATHRTQSDGTHTHAIELAGETYALALDSYILQTEDGREILQPLQPKATVETLVARLQKCHPFGRTFPLLYPADSVGDPLTRRLLTSSVTIQLPPGASPESVAEATGMRLSDVPDYAPGFAIYEAEDPIAALNICQRLGATGSLPLIEIQLAQQRQARSLPNDPLLSAQWHLAFQHQENVIDGSDIRATPVWNYGGQGIRGAGIRIGIIDDGLDLTHEDLQVNVDTEIDYDWNHKDNDPSPGSSRNRHGTACAGVAAARGNNGVGVVGVAPESTLVGLRLTSGSSTDQMEAEAMAHQIEKIAIKSNSWGPIDTGRILENAGPLTRAAWQHAVNSGRNGKGTIFVWAGGNGAEKKDNSNKDGFANSIYTIAVGAADSRAREAYYSERGANLVCVAPSDGYRLDTQAILTTDRSGSAGYTSSNYVSTFGGTSSACPTVAGVVALMLEKNPDLGWRDVQEILLRSSTRIQSNENGWSTNGAGLRFHHQFGAGLVNAQEAVDIAASWQNLPPRAEPLVFVKSTISPIPDNSLTGVTYSFPVSNALRVEHVTVTVNIRHAARGQCAITLTSPSGMVSQLAETHADKRPNYNNWTFSTVRHWGESAQGQWVLHVRDGGKKITGTLLSAELTLYGTDSTP